MIWNSSDQYLFAGKAIFDPISLTLPFLQATLAAVRSQLEEWKAKARDLQTELEDLRTKFHDLQASGAYRGGRNDSRNSGNRSLDDDVVVVRHISIGGKSDRENWP